MPAHRSNLLALGALVGGAALFIGISRRRRRRCRPSPPSQSSSHVTTLAQLEALYGPPHGVAVLKEVPVLTDDYAALIAASPFMALATAGKAGGGLDCSPRGDEAGGLVRVQPDRKTLLLPDRRGNNRVDSLRNIVEDGRVGILFLVPGSGTTLRVNGTAVISIDPQLIASFAAPGKPAPRSVVIVQITSVYFQCSRAIVRSRLWDASRHVDPRSIPSAGEILSNLSKGEVGGATYDAEWPARAKAALW